MGKRRTHTAEVKFKILFFNENGQEARITIGNVGPDRVSRASHFLFGKNSNNVKDVLLVFHHGPCPTRVVQRPINHSFDRGHRIAGRLERLARCRVDLDVSELEALLPGLVCL